MLRLQTAAGTFDCVLRIWLSVIGFDRFLYITDIDVPDPTCLLVPAA